MKVVYGLLPALVLLAAATTSFCQSNYTTTMNKETIPQFYVVGISMRTTNENGQAAKDIEAIWGRFWTEKIQEKIAGKASDDIYAVYKDYETDHTGAYTVIIGLRVVSLENIPAGFVGITIDTDHYQKFVSKGKMPAAVFNTWLEIWQNKELSRAYRVDFTVHGKKYYDGDNAEVETFISVGK